MNEMYEMSQNLHIYSVIAMILTLLIMMLLHKLQSEQEVFVKRNAIVMVFHTSFIASTALTGVIMMAAKHLNFSFANIIMIIGLVAIIVLEVKRSKILKQVVRFGRGELTDYKRVGFNFELIELVLILIVGAIAGMAG